MCEYGPSSCAREQGSNPKEWQRAIRKNTDQAEISEEDRIKAYFSIIISQMDYKSFNKSIKPGLHSAINKLVK